MSTKDIVLCTPLRSAIGRFQGTLSAIRADDLLARLFEAVIDQSGINPAEID